MTRAEAAATPYLPQELAKVRHIAMFSQYRAAIESWIVVGLVLALVIGTQAYQAAHPPRPSDPVRITSILGSSHRTAPATGFSSGEAAAVLGATELDLRQVVMEPGDEMIVDVLAVWGAVTIRVPDGWTVDTRAFPVAGRVRDQRLRPFDALESPVSSDRPAPRLVLQGAVVMGGLVIKS
jgi:hypothetical protein